jgi:hypothetical protein
MLRSRDALIEWLGAGGKAQAEPERWRGLNLLGFALMEARSKL